MDNTQILDALAQISAGARGGVGGRRGGGGGLRHNDVGNGRQSTASTLGWGWVDAASKRCRPCVCESTFIKAEQVALRETVLKASKACLPLIWKNQ